MTIFGSLALRGRTVATKSPEHVPLRWFKNNCVSATRYFTGFQRHKKQARRGVLIVLWSRCVVKEKGSP